MIRLVLSIGVLVMLNLSAIAFEKVPTAALKALKSEKTKPFSDGLVFINGKYIAPPYVVERYGTVIRINGIQATGEIVEWNEFIKTQDGVVANKSEAPAEPESEEEAPALIDDEEEDDPLADLFDDEPKPKKATKKAAPKKKAKPKATVTYTFNGEFKLNPKATKLKKQVADYRAKVDATLRMGGFYCFGEEYTAISGDARMARQLLTNLPKALKTSNDALELRSALRSVGVAFIPDIVAADLYKYRSAYVQLNERLKKDQEKEQIDDMLNGR